MPQGHALVLFELATATPPILEVADASDPVKPSLLCTLIPAQGGRFDQSSTRLLFWSGATIASADLNSRTVTPIGRLPLTPSELTFGPGGQWIAYRVFDSAGGMTLHLFAAGHDQAVYSQAPLGGHSGPPYGPYDQLRFSPDGTLLLDYLTFRPSADIDNLLVLSTAGATVFQEPGTVSGVWSAAGAVLYYPVSGEGGVTGEVDSFDAVHGSQTIATGLKGYYWPANVPDGTGIIYDTYDSSVPGCGGVPHLWWLDLVGAHQATQVSRSVSSQPVFVGRGEVWSNEETKTPCGPGGASARDGVVLAHNMTTRTDTPVDLRGMLPGAGGFGLEESDVGNVVDTWF